MPFLELHTVKGLLSPEQKRYLMEKFSDLLVEVEGGGDPEFRKMVWINIDEREASGWRIGELWPTEEAVARHVEARDAMRMAAPGAQQ